MVKVRKMCYRYQKFYMSCKRKYLSGWLVEFSCSVIPVGSRNREQLVKTHIFNILVLVCVEIIFGRVKS